MSEHQGVCNVCLIPCSWQERPTGGWWVHEWPPNPQIEKWWKEGPNNHDADPGWEPVIPEEEGEREQLRGDSGEAGQDAGEVASPDA
ncbi:hypothetical protein MYRNA_45 [Mycobacterium phage Myrna]|uniref:Uncharacterized protein n=1 Tax=Mycobacterium phage Myrna TaxID=546805 RepID=B5LJ56_9CAUD|nr:gp45 [Mycobacterium phage Myrna]ACH62053.1 hypothetical protein MYRNA_45 [Mycobacterium phage Myrna]